MVGSMAWSLAMMGSQVVGREDMLARVGQGLEGTPCRELGKIWSWSGGGMVEMDLVGVADSWTGGGDTSMLTGSAASTCMFLAASLASLASFFTSTMSEATNHLSMSPCSTSTPLTNDLRWVMAEPSVHCLIMGPTSSVRAVNLQHVHHVQHVHHYLQLPVLHDPLQADHPVCKAVKGEDCGPSSNPLDHGGQPGGELLGFHLQDHHDLLYWADRQEVVHGLRIIHIVPDY